MSFSTITSFISTAGWFCTGSMNGLSDCCWYFPLQVPSSLSSCDMRSLWVPLLTPPAELSGEVLTNSLHFEVGCSVIGKPLWLQRSDLPRSRSWPSFVLAFPLPPKPPENYSGVSFGIGWMTGQETYLRDRSGTCKTSYWHEKCTRSAWIPDLRSKSVPPWRRSLPTSA